MITLETLNELKLKLEEEWEAHSIPHYFRDIFRNSVFTLSRHKAVAIISREIEELKRKKASVQMAIEAVKAREEGLKNIKEMLEYFSRSTGWEQDDNLCQEVMELLSAYRILTLNAVESIIKWKEQLVYALILNKSDSIGKHKTLQFMWENENYILKMRKDLIFLHESDFKKIFCFSELPDPLLIIPSKPLEKKNVKLNERAKFLNIPQMLGKRVKLAHKYILDEDIEEQLQSAQPKVNKRVDEKVAKRVLEELIEHTAEKTLKGLAQKVYDEEKKTVNDLATKTLGKDLIEEFIMKNIRSIAAEVYNEATDGPMKKYLEGILGKYIEDEIDKTVKLIIKEEMQNAKNQKKDLSKAELKNKKEREAAEKKRREEEIALEKRLAKEREEKEKKRKEEELAKKLLDENNSLLAKGVLEWVLKGLHVDIELVASSLYKEAKDEADSRNKEMTAKEIEEAKRLEELRRQEELKKNEDLKRKLELEKLEQQKRQQQLEFEAEQKRLEALSKQQRDLEEEQARLEALKKQREALEAEQKRLEDLRKFEKTKLKSEKSEQLMNSQIAENILRVVIEDEIKSLNLVNIAEQEVKNVIEKRRKTLKNDEEKIQLARRERDLENDKLSEMVYSDVVEKMIERMKFDSLAQSMFEKVGNFRNTMTINTSLIKNTTFDPDDYAVDEFTPGEHSPMEVVETVMKSVMEEMSPRKLEELNYEFSQEGQFNSLKDLEWVPFDISEFSLEPIFSEYLRTMSLIFSKVLPTYKQLIRETFKYIDPCWYWALKNNQIIGALVFSLDYLTEDRKLIVHHISCIDSNLIEGFINAATEFLFNIDSCQEIRINMLVPIGTDLPKDIKKIFTTLKFKWKASADSGVQGCDLNVMGKSRSSAPGKNSRFSELKTFALKAGCLVEPSESSVNLNEKISDEMIHYGNRQCQINSLLNLFGKLDKSGISLTPGTRNRMQGEISEILEIVNSTDSFNFPNIVSLVSDSQEDIGSFLKKYNYLDFTSTQKSSISILEITFKYIGCTFITHQIKGNNYRFIRFKSPEIMVGSDFHIYSVPTSQQNIRAVFIFYENLKEELESDLRREKTDLFYKIENLLQSINFNKPEVIEFSVPAFNKKTNWIVNWMQGYEILPQRDEKSSQYIKKCFETIRINTEAPQPAAGILNVGKSKGFVFDQNFVFCLKHTGLDRVLDMPLFTCLVEQEDWVLG